MNENLWCITFCYRRNCCSCYWVMKSIVHFLSILFYNSHTLSLQNMTHRSPRFCRKSELVNLFNGCLFFLYKQLRHMRMFIMLITSQNMPYFIDLKGYFIWLFERVYISLYAKLLFFSLITYTESMSWIIWTRLLEKTREKEYFIGVSIWYWWILARMHGLASAL